MMKKLLIIALSFVTCITLVQAQELWKEDNGLSGNKCVWTKVEIKIIEDAETGKAVEKWKECKDGIGCVHKFCNGIVIDKYREKGQCNKYCITLQEALPIEGDSVRSISGESGVDLLGNYFGLWYKIGSLVLGLICVLVIVISGVQIIFGGVSEESVTSAKTRIWGALLSLILLFSSALILKTINPLFFT